MLYQVDAREAWPQIEAKARECMTDPQAGSPEQLHIALLEERAFVYRCDDGLLIVTININPNDSERELSIWFAESLADEHGAFERAMPDLELMARAMHCPRITIDSPYLAWTRKAPRAGFRVRNITLVKEVA